MSMKHSIGKKRFAVFFCLCLFSLAVISESVLFIRYGTPRSKLESEQFRYQYIDIYKKFFKKIHKGKDIVCVPQRQANNAKDFLLAKKPGTMRIFLIGGSVAYNFGFYNFEDDLKAVIRDRDFEIISCGMGAYDSYRDMLVEKEILSYKPDLIIVFSGNNEFYSKAKFNLCCYKLNNFLRKSWIYRIAQEYTLERLIKYNIIYYKETAERMMEYKKNMQIMTRMAKLKRVPIVLCTLPDNFRDSAPRGIPPLDKNYIFAHFLLTKKDYHNAVVLFKRFIENNPSNAFGFYFLARAYEGINDYSKAKENYLKSLELDFGNGRASIQSNNIIRAICKQGGAGLADLETAFIDMAPHGLLGKEQFSDECHWYMDYNPLVAAVIIKTLFQNAPVSKTFHPMSLKERGSREDLVEDVVKKAISRAINSDNCLSEQALSEFEMLYSMNPDAFLKARYSKNIIKKCFSGNLWTDISMADFESRWPNVLYHIGETCRRNEMYQEALERFNEAISLDKNLYLAYLGNALVYHALGDKKKTKENIDEAEKVSNNLTITYYKEILGF